MNHHLKAETSSVRLLCDDRHETVSNIELELSLTNHEPHNCSDAESSNDRERIDQEGNSVGTAKSQIFEKTLRAVRSHQVRIAKNENQSRSFLAVVRYVIALSLCFLPVVVFALEMVPERCKICLDTVKLNVYFVTSALCGGFGAVLLSYASDEYFMARFLGGSVGSIGALYTISMILKEIPPDNVLHAVFLLV